MSRKLHIKPNLRVIDGGLHSRIIYKNVLIIAAPNEHPPFTAEAMAFEEDTYLIMSAEPTHIPPAEHPLRLIAELASLEPEKPGSVVVRGNDPLQLLAVVHDVDDVPTWREEWIENALRSIFLEVNKRQIETLGLPILGSKHGKLDEILFSKLLGNVLAKTEFDNFRRLWLIAPISVNSNLIEMLKQKLKIN